MSRRRQYTEYRNWFKVGLCGLAGIIGLSVWYSVQEPEIRNPDTSTTVTSSALLSSPSGSTEPADSVRATYHRKCREGGADLGTIIRITDSYCERWECRSSGCINGIEYEARFMPLPDEECRKYR